MANYADYRQVPADQIPSQTVTNAKLSFDARHCFCVKWFYGTPCCCSPGCCCLWSAPTGVRRLFWEAWGAGGNGHGSCSCDRCQHFVGAGGGYYNSKMISTGEQCQYTVCAGGVYRCWSQECVGCQGCTSYVNGYNLSNFCAIGGWRGEADGNWANPCFSYWTCCLGPTSNGGDFGMGNHYGSWSGPFNCHCHHHYTEPTAAPFLGGEVGQGINVCWIRCGCWNVPYGHGGQGGMSVYCGSGVCGQGGTGGGGVVKVTYI